MKLLHNIIVSTFLFATAGSAYAVPTTDFKALADGSVYGESGYSSLNIGIMSVTATKDSSSAFAYLDRNKAGLGVCGNVPDDGPQGNSGSNKCRNLSDTGEAAGDDNVTTGETLSFSFSQAVKITSIWFNNNHDPDRSLVGDTIDIGGDNYLFSASDFDASRSSGDGTLSDAVAKRNADFLYDNYGLGRYVSVGSDFDISWVNDQFYISAIEFEAVPEPGILALLSIGLIGLVAARRK